MNFGKYKRQYFMAPTPTYDWVKKEYIDNRHDYKQQKLL